MAFGHKTARKRVYSKIIQGTHADPQQGHVGEWAVEFSDLICNMAFLIGSVCFLYSDTGIYSAGVWLFIIASVINFGLAGHTLHEHVHTASNHVEIRDQERSEILEAVMYVSSSLVYAVGCIFFMPGLAEDFSGYGAWLSVIGSFNLVYAAYFNQMGMLTDKSDSEKVGIHPRHYDAVKLLYKVTLAQTLSGAVLFTCGSFMYLPRIHSNCRRVHDETCQTSVQVGTALFIAGSILFVMQSGVSILALYLKTQASGGSQALDGETKSLL
uniref:YrhK domain-containing protein n=1 Tax=Alexandrium catenella TaxID=2925 RepID=A0A7S1PZV2_ALECA|mmetsp:Transcript_12397/g.34053  ORF Transcript_12397/g.34053 Transcript_12397/m.34053 type:complete len:269 (+) Transcript_12397:71-877(+)|eukprot:CAMPEP_0171207622 /NCGR_PEP_ID=MMETSP0790-20130122/27668_1 /TAXON_ID=2925 /ORGANISM="Alexandrium catenella, Strain OF101" /LENGTH=268 /DNA_ID=CAMNT_0011673193 /DNA_START=68 /DNA_END=874 /DNA_ORIENTATION=-